MKMCHEKFCEIHKKTSVMESYFYSVRAPVLQLYESKTSLEVSSCEFCEILRNFIEHPIFINTNIQKSLLFLDIYFQFFHLTFIFKAW